MYRVKLFSSLVLLLALIVFAAWQLWHALTTGEIYTASRFGYAGYTTFKARPPAFITAVLVQFSALVVVPLFLVFHFPWWKFSRKPSIWESGARPRKRIG